MHRGHRGPRSGVGECARGDRSLPWQHDGGCCSGRIVIRSAEREWAKARSSLVEAGLQVEAPDEIATGMHKVLDYLFAPLLHVVQKACARRNRSDDSAFRTS